MILSWSSTGNTASGHMYTTLRLIGSSQAKNLKFNKLSSKSGNNLQGTNNKNMYNELKAASWLAHNAL